MNKKIYIIGTGPGSRDYLLPIARRKIEESSCLIGAKRHLKAFRDLGKKEVAIEGHFDRVIPYIKKHRAKERIAVLVSGDPGIYSFLDRLSKELRRNAYAVIPGISALQLAFARMGESWNNAKISSLHGRSAVKIVDEVKGAKKLFLFTDAGYPPNRIAARLLRGGVDNRRVIVLENLSYPNERILDTNLKTLSRMKRRFGLCALIIEHCKRAAKKGRLYGIGIGPGDAGLVTLKAKEILERVDTVFVPKASEDGESCARSIVEAVTRRPKNLVELTFPMTKDRTLLNRYWAKASNMISKELGKGKDAAFVTIGDPFIYSTYIHLLKILRRNFPAIDIETIPGVSAFNAAAAIAKLPLVEADEKMAIVPVGNDLRGLRETLEEFDTVVLMKVGSKLDKVKMLLKEIGLLKASVLVSRAGHKDEKIVYDLASLKGKKAGYLSVVIVKKGGAG